ncbi:MAG: sensor histidine kinase [Spirochaetaceae bacterium]|nr:MAG: sensor histidine kinase [Spirochaetaceae bacterium]
MEITQELNLTAEQQNLLAMHSALNVLNVILYELFMLQKTYGENERAQTVETQLHAAADKLSDSSASHHLMTSMEGFIDSVNYELRNWKNDIQASKADLTTFTQSLENLNSIFEILRVRARELATRFDNPDAWQVFENETLRHNYLNVLLAIEKNSKGRYRIVYNLAEHDEGAYLVHLSISSHNDSQIKMPAVFQDIVRDLLANARKYTHPGGRIEAGIYDSGKELRCVISDSGHGIPESEIANVIAFGGRASNASAPTRGGGFGLTKAYFFTKHFGGRMWIYSDVGKGTRIEIRIPSPST